MQPSVYLQHADYGLFDVDTETDISTVIRASGLIDAYLQRPEGLIYDADNKVMVATGQPIEEVLRVPFSGQVVFSRTPVVQVVFISTWDGFRWADITNRTGEALDPATGLYAVPFQVFRCFNCRFKFIAGYPSYNQLPFPVKQACAALTKALVENCEFMANIKYQKAGDAELERFKDTIFDTEIKALLGPYRRVAH